MTDVTAWAKYLFDAEQRREPVALITETEPNLTIEEAYEIQEALVRQKLAGGQRIVGAKLGLTSRAKQEAMGVHEPLYAWLTDAMVLPAETPLSLSELIHPRVEPEIVFVIGEELAGPGVTAYDVLAATSGVGCGLEILDSRYANFQFTLPDAIADNASSARFVLGPELVKPDFDLSLIGCLFELDGELVGTATGAASLGHPAEAVALLANWLGHRGQSIERGWIVLSGALANAVPVKPGSHVVATFSRLGCVRLRAIA